MTTMKAAISAAAAVAVIASAAAARGDGERDGPPDPELPHLAIELETEGDSAADGADETDTDSDIDADEGAPRLAQAPAAPGEGRGDEKVDGERDDDLDTVRAPADARAAVTGGAAPGEPGLDPYAVIVGGVKAESLQRRDGDEGRDRSTTLALSRFGLRGNLGGGVYIESEFEVNAGPHGTSVWEGQAALQVRNQLIRYTRGGFRIDAGRVTDPTSLDFHSAHVADQLLTDGFTRAPILASGFNRGNGVLAQYEIGAGLTTGIALNAANPTSTTASLQIGGTYPPFSRFYFAPHQHVGRDASMLPSSDYHIEMLSPSLSFSSDRVSAHGAVQMFRVDTNVSSDENEPIIGYNIRAGAEAELWPDRLSAFLNGSRVENSVVDPDDGAYLLPEAFVGYTLTLGIDTDIYEESGVGLQYSLIRERQGNTSRRTEHFFNLGGTYWLTDTTSVGARAGVYTNCTEAPGEACEREGARTLFATMRTIL